MTYGFAISVGERRAEECFLKEEAKDSVNTNTAVPSVTRNPVWVAPYCLRYGEDHPLEATGLAMDAAARGALIINYLFLGPALIKLAENAAGCLDETEYDQCNGKIFGMKPSSLLSNIAVVAGMSGAMTMPLLGVMVDHTPYRRAAGLVSAVILVIINGLQAVLNSHTWTLVVFLQIVANFFFLMHNTSQYAYTSDLVKYNNNNNDTLINNHNNNKNIAKYTAFFSIILYITMLLFLLIVISCSALVHANVVQIAIISQLVSFIVAGYFFGLAWFYLFRECPPNSYLPQGEKSMLWYGFKKNILTMKRISKLEFAPLKWFYLSIALSEAAATSFPLIATTFMTTHLKMSSNEIGLAYLIVLLGGIPGSKLGEVISNRYSAVRSAQLCLVLFSLTTGLAAIILRSPLDWFKILYLCAFWGMSLGWLHPTHITILCSIIPSSQTTELMGLYIFASQILSWLPPLFFTALNESGFSMSCGLVSLNIFFAVAMIFLFKLEFSVQSKNAESSSERNDQFTASHSTRETT